MKLKLKPYFIFFIFCISCSTKEEIKVEPILLEAEYSNSTSLPLKVTTVNIPDFQIQDFEVLTDDQFLTIGSSWTAKSNEDYCLSKINILGDVQWKHTVVKNGHDQGRFLTKEKDGHYLAGGFVFDSKQNKEIYFQKLNDEKIIWDKEYHLGLGVSDEAYNAKLLSNGDYLIMGYTKSNIDGFLLRTNNKGKTKAKLKSGGDHKDYIFDAVEMANGGILAVGSWGGYHDATGNDFTVPSADIYIVKTDAQLNELWTKQIDNGAHDFAKRIIATNNGEYYVFGSSQRNSSFGFDMYLAKINTDGEVLWDKYYGDLSWDYGEDIIVHEDRLILLGTSDEESSRIKVITTDLNGETLDQVTIKSQSDLESKSIQYSDNKIYVSGNVIGDQNTRKGFIVQFPNL